MTSLSSLSAGGRRRWLILTTVLFAQLMIVLDTTIVNVALSSIQHDLHFSQNGLTWVINGFLITFGSLLLLAGRLGDLLGRRRVFLLGVALFTVASLLCGLAGSGSLLIAARALQGIGAAMQASVILAIIHTTFVEPAERARAMSAYVFTAVAGGSIGLLAGGVLTQVLDWHWIFFVNLPIGIGTILAGRALMDADTPSVSDLRHIDWLGSVLVTAAVAAGVYAIVEVPGSGWGSASVLGFLTLAAVLLGGFLAWEARVAHPIMPLRILRLRGLVASSVIRGFLVCGMYSTFFLGTLYLERILHMSALQAGLAYLPWTLSVMAMSLGVNRRLVARFGPMRVLIVGMLVTALGLGLLQTTQSTTAFFPTIFFAFMLIGLGIGNAFTPLLTIAMAEIPAADAGLGSGIVNVSQQVAGALGLAILSTVATTHTQGLLGAHGAVVPALLSGYHLAWAVGAAAVAGGGALALVILPRPRPASAVVADPREAEIAPELEAEGGELAVWRFGHTAELELEEVA